ncbi:DENN domain-containing 5B-like [Paramuricea clavata]|nr:DENN domain-containing 5B-like [Paramuricea clavata]
MGLYCKDTDDIDALLPSKSSLCCLDINNRVLTVPEELPELPYAEELAQELSEVLAKYNKKANGTLPSSGRSSPSQIPRKKASDVRLTARKSVKKIDAIKAGLSHLKTSNSTSDLSMSEGINPRLASLEKVAQKTGIQINVSADTKEKSSADRELDANHVEDALKGLGAKELRQLEFNLEIREILVNWFTQVFLYYESFVIHPLDNQDMEQWIQNREQMENFDKAAFLSDQPATFLPFLAPFIETQMFASFIDTKLIGWWSEPDSKLAVFDQRILQMKYKLGIVRSHSYERCQSVKSACKCWGCGVMMVMVMMRVMMRVVLMMMVVVLLIMMMMVMMVVDDGNGGDNGDDDDHDDDDDDDDDGGGGGGDDDDHDDDDGDDGDGDDDGGDDGGDDGSGGDDGGDNGDDGDDDGGGDDGDDDDGDGDDDDYDDDGDDGR